MVRRPVSVTVLALFNLAFGGLFLVCGVASMDRPKVSENGKDLTQDYQEYKEREIPAYRFMEFLEVGLKLVLAVGFILAGVGMLQVRAWGRLCALGCSGLVILHEVIKTVYDLTLVNPAVKKYPHLVGGLSAIGTWFTVVWGIIAGLFGVAQLALLLMPGMGQGFREGFPEEVDDKEAWLRRRWPARRDDEEEDEDDLPPRKPVRKARREEDVQPPPRRKPPRPRPRDEDDE